MNYKAVVNVLGKILFLLAVFMIIPIIVDVIYQENTWQAFLYPLIGCLIVSSAITIFVKPKKTVLHAKEGFVIVALAWLVISLIGAIPFVITKVLPNYMDAFFETVSGFTTTGASVIADVESCPHSILFWRSFSNWIGGMGILVFVLAITPNFDSGSIHVLRAESTGPNVGKLVSKMSLTARILYTIYIVLTILLFIMLICGRMPVFDSICASLSTAGTGGFSVKNASIGAYGSTYYDIVIAIFMFIFGINFSVFYLILIGSISRVLRNEELLTYVVLVIVATFAIAIDILSVYGDFGEAMHHSFFQVTSIVSTTGFSSVDFDGWPTFAKMILLFLMIIGASAGSTAGGFKIARGIVLAKVAFADLRKMLNPRVVVCPKLNGEPISTETAQTTKTYIITYFALILVSFLLISIENYGDVETNISAVLASINNIGPGFGKVGPTSTYFGYSWFSKLILCLDMLAGRLEIFPIILLFHPTTWKK